MKYSKTNFNEKTVLITGGAGFIGSNIAFYLQENYPRCNIVIFDCFRNEKRFSNSNLQSFGHYKNLIGFTGEVICGNITSSSDLNLLDKYSFDIIFHQAAISDTRVDDQEIIMKTNVNSFRSLLNKSKKDNAILVYASSASTYGNLISPQKVGIEKPDNPYGFSKYLMDEIAKKYSSENPDLSIIGLRFFNVYGPKEFYKSSTSSMVLQLAHQIIEGKLPRLFEGSEKISRDFIYIEDVIQANVKAASVAKSGIYNIGTGISRSFQEIADILQKELNTNLETEYFKNPFSGYQFHTQADISLSREHLGFDPNYSLELGIKDYLPEIKHFFGAINK